MEKTLIRTRDFTPEELKKWQLRLLEILVYFRDFCEGHQLKFWLTGGTLLGAIRHHGFIPWDDDIDVQMPRDDYEKLLTIWNKEADTSKFVCEHPTEQRNTGFPMAMIRNVNTTCIYEHSAKLDICHGLKIDVEYMDGVPSNFFAAKLHYIIENVMDLCKIGRIPSHTNLAKKTISWIILKFAYSNHLKWKVISICEKFLRKYSFYNCEYARFSNCNMQKRSSFDILIYVDFEGYKMPIPKEYNDVLTRSYGDYMKLPPENERHPITDGLAFYDLDNSYLKYKGKYYFV